MALKPSRYKLEQALTLAGQPFRVAGLLQLELPDASVATRYLLEGEKGAAQILEERPGRLSLLRPFPPAAAPEPTGNQLSVMGMRYALSGVDKLKIVGAEGGAVGGARDSGLLLSGRFDGESGLILREFAPGGAATQTFYSVKPVADSEIMTAEQALALQEAQRAMAEQRAAAEAESGSSSGMLGKIGGVVVTLVVVAVLAFACTSDDEGSGSGSARSGSVHYSGGHGGK